MMKRHGKSIMIYGLIFGMLCNGGGVADAKAKKPALSKTKITIKVGKKKKIKVKKVKPKKTVWSLTKAGKKVVSLSKKKKNTVTVKGKKPGKATLTAKIKVGKKSYRKKVKITVKEDEKNNNLNNQTVTPSPSNSNNNTATDMPKNSSTPDHMATAEPTPSAITPSTGAFSDTDNTPVCVYDNLDLDTDYIITTKEKPHEVPKEDVAAFFDKTIDLDTFFQNWKTLEEATTKTFGDASAVMEPYYLLSSRVEATNKVTISGTDADPDGSYIVYVTSSDEGYECLITDLNELAAAIKMSQTKEDTGETTVKADIYAVATDDVPTARVMLKTDKNQKTVSMSVCWCDEEGADGKGIIRVKKNEDGTWCLIVNKEDVEKSGLTLEK